MMSIDDYINVYTMTKAYNTLVEILKTNGSVMTISSGDYLSLSGIGISNDIERKLPDLYGTLMAQAKKSEDE